MKYRIMKELNSSKYYLQKKRFIGWTDVKETVLNPTDHLIGDIFWEPWMEQTKKFDTVQDAENHLSELTNHIMIHEYNTSNR